MNNTIRMRQFILQSTIVTIDLTRPEYIDLTNEPDSDDEWVTGTVITVPPVPVLPENFVLFDQIDLDNLASISDITVYSETEVESDTEDEMIELSDTEDEDKWYQPKNKKTKLTK